MGIINKLYDVHAVPYKNVQFSIDEGAKKKSPTQCNIGSGQKPPPGLPPLPMSLALLANLMWEGMKSKTSRKRRHK